MTLLLSILDSQLAAVAVGTILLLLLGNGHREEEGRHQHSDGEGKKTTFIRLLLSECNVSFVSSWQGSDQNYQRELLQFAKVGGANDYY